MSPTRRAHQALARPRHSQRSARDPSLGEGELQRVRSPTRSLPLPRGRLGDLGRPLSSRDVSGLYARGHGQLQMTIQGHGVM